MYNYNNFTTKTTAVALGYDKIKDITPKVIASGHGIFAQSIIEIAKEHNIPLHQDADLVKILSALEINAYIPIEVYDIVAKIITYIYAQNDKCKNTTEKR